MPRQRLDPDSITTTVGFAAPPRLVEKIDALRAEGQSRSALVRDLVERALEEPAA